MEELDLSMYKSRPLSSYDVNYTKIPVTRFGTNEKGVEGFNRVYTWVKSNQHNFFLINRTRSGGISKQHLRFPCYDIQTRKNSVELTLLCRGGQFRFLFRTGYTTEEGGPGVSGREGYNKFKEVCQKHGINLEDLAIKNGKEVKDSIEKLHIGLDRQSYKNLTFTNAHHIDLNSAFMSGIKKAFPVLEEPIQEIYDKRKENPVYKGVLNTAQGYMQSEWCKINKLPYSLAHLSKAGIAFCNRKVEELAKRLTEAGRVVIAYNTDGLWYVGDVFHDLDEGIGMGEWKNDHINCKIRFKSDGAYEYIEPDGSYHPVVRGFTRLDRMKPRSQWEWGNIYQDECEVIKYYFNNEEGILMEENEYEI